MRRALLATLVAAAIPALAWSAKVKVWHHHASAHYDRAEFKQAVLTSEGAVRLARQVKPLADIDAAHVWAVAEDAAGNLFAATGNEGKVFKVTPDSKVNVVYTSEDSQVFSLAVAADGSVYAGTGPSGSIVRITTDGKSEVLWKGVESYVWSLAMDSKGESIYAGTGPQGRIYRISRTGQADVFYATKQDHVLSLALTADGQLYAGTDKRGLVYRIDPHGKGFVVLDAPQSEVRTLLVTQDAVYAGTSSPLTRRGPTVAGSSTSDERAAVVPASTTVIVRAPDKPFGADSNDKETKESAANPSTSGSASGPSASSGPSVTSSSPPAAGENSVYRIALDGAVREVFRDKSMILTLLQKENRLLVGTGRDGQLFELREAEKERAELARLDHTQIHCLYQRKDGSVVIGTGDPGKLYLLENRYVSKGRVTSDVLDAKSLSRWGSLRWQAETPQGTRLSVAVRSGNVAEPDETWSDWSEEETDSRQAAVAAPPARFLQYRVTMASDDPQVTPGLRSLAVRYMPINVAPEVGAIDVPDLDAVALENPKKLKLKWAASDANEDELAYALYYRKDSWKNWVELESDLDKREYEWDTTTTPAGVYQIKVVASDRKDNPDEQALTAEKVSSPFIIDHVPPAVTAKVTAIEGSQAVVEGSSSDGHTRLVSASYSVDSQKWSSAFPADGLFDSKSETFRFKTGTLKPGTHVLVLRVTDAAGNVGSSDLVFEVPGK